MIDGGTTRMDSFKKRSIRMAPTITTSNVAAFFRGTRGRVTADVLVRHFGVDKPGKALRMENTLQRLEDTNVIVKFPNGVYQYAEYAMQDAMKPLPK